MVQIMETQGGSSVWILPVVWVQDPPSIGSLRLVRVRASTTLAAEVRRLGEELEQRPLWP